MANRSRRHEIPFKATLEMKSKLFDHSGHIINSTDEEADQALPPGVQALIETRINSAIDNLRERNRYDLKELSRDHIRKWRFLAITSSIITLITIFYAPDKILNIISNQIDKRLTEPMLISSADRLIESKMNSYVSEKLAPLMDRATKLESTIDGMDRQISEKQLLLEEKQNTLQKQLRIQELAISSKAGSRKAYIDLLALSKDPNNGNDLINASLKEIELFYDVDRKQLSYEHLVKAETMKDPGYSVDEVIFIMRNNKDLTEAAINTLSQLKSKAVIAELCQVVFDSDDLHVVNRATRAIQILSGEEIHPLDFEKVKQWWSLNKDNKEFNGNYDGYCEVIKMLHNHPIMTGEFDTLLKSLSSTIEKRPFSLTF